MFTKSFLQQIEKSCDAQMERMGGKRNQIEAVLGRCTDEEAEALRCLYASMPVSDAADYPPELFLGYAKHGAYLWKKGPFAGKIPEELFAGYVLHHRVNNENITDSRGFFYELLKDRIMGMSMEAAILDINYWCASEATYRTTDKRTACPECVYTSAYGRCGEESAFAVSVFRSVGIPARQVYAPLWSHCDDNHAWVEVWCDGSWRFLGACEPEEILNKGWFINASSRAMMVSSRWTLPVIPEDEIVGKKGMAQVLNHLERYAYISNLEVTVQDTNGNVIPNARISFEVMNYSHFGEIAAVYADENGKTILQTGLGSIHVTASSKDAYGEVLVNTMEQTSCTVVLGTTEDKLDQWEEIYVVAPNDAPINQCVQSQEELKIGRQKSDAVTKQRLEKVETFYNEKLAEKSIVDFSEEDKVCCREIMKQARGNQAAIAGFLSLDTKNKWPKEWKLKILNSIREKDYLDISTDILEEHCAMAACYAGNYPDEIFVPYILCPRVDNEMICGFRSFIQGYLSDEEKEEIKADPVIAWKMINHRLVSDPDLEYGNLITSAQGALASGYGSILTKKVVCVQILRTLGIPARLNPADGCLEIWKSGSFRTLEESFLAERTAAIIIQEPAETAWTYFQNWTIARFEESAFQTLMLCDEGNCQIDREIVLFPGKYRILTSNRLPNGNILAKKMVFELKDGEKKQIYLEQMEAQPSDLLEDNDVSDFFLTREDGSRCMVSELVKEQKGLFIWLEESQEPTEHILNEIYQRSEAFEQLSGVKMYFVIKNEQVKYDPTLKHTLTRVSNVEFLYDDFGADMGILARRMYLEPGKLPLIVIIDEKMTGIYGVAGYNVGSADMILKILNIQDK